jgi:steroid delta-isomerase-like uncharacterized protein
MGEKLMTENAVTIANQAFECINAHDVDRYAALHADDYEMTDTATGEIFHGQDGARKNMEGWFTPFPDARVEVVNVVAGDEWVAIEGIGRGTHNGPLIGPTGEFPPTRKSFTVPFCTTLRVTDGKIVAVRDYYNGAEVMQQLGLTPKPNVDTV